MKEKKFIPYASQSINDEDREAVSQSLQDPIITRGETVEAFEKAIAEYCDVKYAVAFNSGSSALAAAYYAAELNPYDRLLTTPNTFVATASKAFQAKAQVMFIDIERTTGNLNLEQLEHNVNVPSTRGRDFITPVHFAGIPVNMERLDSMIKDPDTVVIEDAAHALGSSYSDGQKVGSCSYSAMTVFSFHAIKTITTGEGGLVTTNSEHYYERLRSYRNNGIEYLEHDYAVHDTTGNYHLTDFQAALGLSQLKRISSFIKKRKTLVEKYETHLKDCDVLSLFTSEENTECAHHLFIAQIDTEKVQKTREQIREELLEKGIGTQVHYKPLYRHPFFTKENGDLAFYFPEMEGYYASAITLPLFYDMNVNDVNSICKELLSILKQ